MLPIRTANSLIGCVVALTALANLFGSSKICGQEFEPFTAYVATEEAYARCGPATEYYRTDPLRHGQTLEVYTETKDGWLGVRPPDESFCWVIAEAIEARAGQNVGTVIEDKTVAWIGTQLGRARKYRWQVRMSEGEQVTIISRSERQGPEGPQLWYRIVPPSGEFRWVHRNDVVMTSEDLVKSVRARSTVTSKRDQENVIAESSRRAERKRSVELVDHEQEESAPIGSGLKPELRREAPDNFVDTMKEKGLLATIEFLGKPRVQNIDQAKPAANPSQDNWTAGERNAVRVASHVEQNVPAVAQTSAISETPIAPVRPVVAAASAEQIAAIDAQARGATVDELSLLFSRLMTRRVSAMEAEPVRRAATAIVVNSRDQAELNRAQQLAQRIEEYQSIARRRDGVAGVPSMLAPTVGVDAATPIPGVTTIPSLTPRGQVTQEGFLVQVYSARKSTPPFALTDHAGRTLAYVTPVPGVNIRLHLNSHVAIKGQQSFLRGMNTPHIMAMEAFRTPE